MRERPPTVPSEATWEAGDDEWAILPRDADGKIHGLATYWRPDGTLVNHCNFAHGVPQGWFKRYHESGEVSRAGAFVDGKIHGVDACFRSTAPTTERAFPSSMPANVWRYEVDTVMGRATSARWFDRDGNRVTDTGEPFPDRPAGVADAAVYFSTSATWVAGGSDDAGAKHGSWRTWSRDGVLVAEAELDHGKEVATHRFACAEDAEVHVALRDGRRVDAVTAARRWWERASSAQDTILAGDALLRALESGPEMEGIDRGAILERVADMPGVMWVFTDDGRRCYQAQAAALDELARETAAAGHLDEAVALCNRAIATEHHYGPCAARATKIDALRRLGRDDEAFSLARELLAADPDRPGFDELRADPRFAAWLSSLSTDGMTADGAWDVLGKLEAVAAPITGEAGERTADTDVTWPIEPRSPELARWIELAPKLRATYRGEFVAAGASSIAAAVAAEDGTWVARLEGLFLPVSVVLVEDEEIWHATWAANDRGTSHVFYTHQDEPGFWPHAPSLAAFVAGRLSRDTKFEDIHIPAATKARWARALQLLRGVPPPPEIAELYPRTGSIVHHLLGVGLAHDLSDAPGFDRWQTERTAAATLPHLQAYWLLHHLVFDNREELPYLIEHAARAHPAVAELVKLATAALAGELIDAPWWDDTKVRGLRTRALDERHDRVFGDAARGRLRDALADRDDAGARIEAARASLGEHPILQHWMRLENIAGSLAGFEERILDKVIADDDERMDYFMRQKNGHTSILIGAFEGLYDASTPQTRPLFDAAVARGAAFAEDHASVVPGSLVGLGATTDDFATLHAAAVARIGNDRIGRRRRLELAVVSARRFAQPAARAFVIGEAERYARQLAEASWQVDTASYALFRLLELEPATGGAILGGSLADASFSGANWKPALRLIAEARRRKVATAAPGILAAIDRKLGRHDDGDRAEVIRAYVACGGTSAPLEERLAAIDDVRADCERCAFLAGLVDLDPARWRDDAHAALAQLLDGRLDSMRNGAATSLLKAIDDAKLAGFAELVQRVHGRAEGDKWTNASHKQWLADAIKRMV